jgi:hypothetical protein
MNNLEDLRKNYSIDRPPIININNNLSLDPVVPVITIIRPNNYITPDFEGRRVKDLDEIEAERARLYGKKMDLNIEKIMEDMKGISIKVPKFDRNGRIETYSNTDYKEISDLDPLDIKTEDIPLFNLIARIPTMDSNNRIVSLSVGLRSLMNRGGLSGDVMKVALQTLLQNLATENIKQGNISIPILKLIKSGIRNLGDPQKLLQQTISEKIATYDTTTGMFTFTKKELYKGSLISLVLIAFLPEGGLNNFNRFCDYVKTLNENQLINFPLNAGNIVEPRRVEPTPTANLWPSGGNKAMEFKRFWDNNQKLYVIYPYEQEVKAIEPESKETEKKIDIDPDVEQPIETAKGEYTRRY